MTDGRPVLEVRDLSRSFGKVRAVDSLSFDIGPGRIFGFVGPNGAGKTTTMRIVATLDLPDSGDAWVDGVSVLVEPRAVRRKIGFMADQFVPYPNLDVREYLDFFARANGLRGERRTRTVESVAAFCRLGDLLDRPAAGLSKGMGQRLHLARTLLHDPVLLILDEPASGLDPHARVELRDLLRELAATGKSILISSHILSELSEVCDGVIVVERGRRVVAGRIDEIARGMDRPRQARLRALGEPEAAQRFLLTQPLVRDVAVDGVWLRFGFDGDDEALAALLAGALGQGLRVVELHRDEADLEDIFLHTTRGHVQ